MKKATASLPSGQTSKKEKEISQEEEKDSAEETQDKEEEVFSEEKEEGDKEERWEQKDLTKEEGFGDITHSNFPKTSSATSTLHSNFSTKKLEEVLEDEVEGEEAGAERTEREDSAYGVEGPEEREEQFGRDFYDAGAQGEPGDMYSTGEDASRGGDLYADAQSAGTTDFYTLGGPDTSRDRAVDYTVGGMQEGGSELSMDNGNGQRKENDWVSAPKFESGLEKIGRKAKERKMGYDRGSKDDIKYN